MKEDSFNPIGLHGPVQGEAEGLNFPALLRPSEAKLDRGGWNVLR